jgi:hypothetical protein
VEGIFFALLHILQLFFLGGGELLEVFGDPTTNGIYTNTGTWVMSEPENHSSVEH